jgi:hypothetical protein
MLKASSTKEQKKDISIFSNSQQGRKAFPGTGRGEWRSDLKEPAGPTFLDCLISLGYERR